MRSKIIIIQFLTLLTLGVLAGWGGYYGKGVLIDSLQLHSPTPPAGLELSSRLELFTEWLKQREQESEVARFIKVELSDEWLFFSVPIILGIFSATILSLMTLIFIRKDTTAKPITYAAEPEEAKEKTSDAVELLAHLQKEGRLIDFLQEDISSYDDAQVGAAVRSIHQNTKTALAKIVTLEAVMAESEGDSVEVKAGFDPSAIRLTGNIKGDPPFTGSLSHRGWRVTRLAIQTRPPTHDSSIIEPSEVEVA